MTSPQTPLEEQKPSPRPVTPLAQKMCALADSGHPRADELREVAAEFEKATAGFWTADQTVTVQAFMGAYARARRLWCQCSGEPLV